MRIFFTTCFRWVCNVGKLKDNHNSQTNPAGSKIKIKITFYFVEEVLVIHRGNFLFFFPCQFVFFFLEKSLCIFKFCMFSSSFFLTYCKTNRARHVKSSSSRATLSAVFRALSFKILTKRCSKFKCAGQEEKLWETDPEIRMHNNTLKKELYEAEPLCFCCCRCCYFSKQVNIYFHR